VLLSEQAKGRMTAETLLKELTIPPGSKLLTAHLQSVELPSERLKFFHHQEGLQKKEPTKTALLKDMQLNGTAVPHAVLAFCSCTLETNTLLTFDIDHVFPFAKIKEKQAALLKYLNEKKDFAAGFMGDNLADAAHKKEIEVFFKREGTKIKGAQYFFEVCYNDLGNLLHLSHHINRDKTDLSPRAWFDEYFPTLFNADRKKRGDIHAGVIMERIFDPKGCEVLSFEKDEEGGEIKVYLHQGSGMGLGSFVRDWFKENAKKVIGRSGNIHVISKQLIKMLRAEFVKGEKASGTLKKALVGMNEVLNVMRVNGSIGSVYSQDSS
jgi:hypothetical protein